MPAYDPQVLEPRWQKHWEEQKTFRTPDQSDKPKYYILDMFPYPSGAGLHVGHPEGYTATDILARYRRMCGFNVLHPMGWDAFGLPAEQHAIETGTHPREKTQENIAKFRQQIKELGFSYDWDREVDTTDPQYVKWTQWIFLQLFDTWYDPEQKRGRPIAELPIPPHLHQEGPAAESRYRDSMRLAYQAEVPVNWCPFLGTVLANEEIVDGKSERGGHPVVRMPLRQWLLRITAYAERLLDDLGQVDWSDSIKKMQQDWIGRSEGAEVDFHIAGSVEGPVIRIFTTRPDTLFGATYMVLAPEHPLVETLTTPEQRLAVDAYRQAAARKSDMERTELAKQKSGVFTGAYAINPVNDETIPIWIADYVLISYGTGAIMAVPAHDERDLEFARQFRLPVRPVVRPSKDWLAKTKVYTLVKLVESGAEDSFEVEQSDSAPRPANPQKLPTTVLARDMALLRLATRAWSQIGESTIDVVAHLYENHCEQFSEAFTGEGTAIDSGSFSGLATAEFKKEIIAWLQERGLGSAKVNFKLRDWLFSRQRYWGEPFPILHEVGADGQPTGAVEPLDLTELPLTLPVLDDYKPSGRPEPPLEKAAQWLWVTRNGKRYKRESNTMPQWAGSCWYFLRYLDPHNPNSLCASAREKHWMPVDLYVGGAEHAVLHLLYSRFWHKVLFDRGHVHTPEPFLKLVNQGMILGEREYTGFKKGEIWISAAQVDTGDASDRTTHEKYERVKLPEEVVEKQGEYYVLKDQPDIRIEAREYKMSKSRGNVINPDDVIRQYGADSMRLYEMFMGPLEATKPWSMRGVEGVYRFLGRVWRLVVDDRAENLRLNEAVSDVEPDRDTLRKLHQAIKKVTEDLDGMRFNTAIAAMMELVNHLTRLESRPRGVLSTFVLLLSPFAPHLAEELWEILGHDRTLAYEPWPRFDLKLTLLNEIEIPVQVNGKVRSKVTVPADADKSVLEAAAMADEKIKALLEGKNIVKIIVVPKKLVNIVIG